GHAGRRRAAGIVEQDVDRSELLARRVGSVLDARPFREVRRKSDRLGAARPDFGDRLIQRFLPACYQRDRNALSRERVGYAASESLAAAENQRRFSLELKIHFSLHWASIVM